MRTQYPSRLGEALLARRRRQPAPNASTGTPSPAQCCASLFATRCPTIQHPHPESLEPDPIPASTARLPRRVPSQRRRRRELRSHHPAAPSWNWVRKSRQAGSNMASPPSRFVVTRTGTLGLSSSGSCAAKLRLRAPTGLMRWSMLKMSFGGFPAGNAMGNKPGHRHQSRYRSHVAFVQRFGACYWVTAQQHPLMWQGRRDPGQGGGRKHTAQAEADPH
jgi:hypothetical protein